MTGAAEHKKLTALVKRLRTQFAPAAVANRAPDFGFEEADPVVREVLYSLLVWETSSSNARTAFRKLTETFLDVNHLRVAMPDEIAAALGDRYPRAVERASRLRAVLFDIFKRENGLQLSRVTAASKRDARTYLDSLEGIPPFAAARVAAVSMGVHAFAVDDRLLRLLVSEKVIGPTLSASEAGRWLEHHVPVAESEGLTDILQHWSDTSPVARAEQDASGASKGESRAQGERSKSGKTKVAKPKDAGKEAAKPATEKKKERKATKKPVEQ
jgi:endonuclease III